MSGREAKPDAWMPLYIGDWDGATGHLSNEQDGAYGRLVRWYWRNGPLPDEDAKLASLVRADLRAWRRLRPALEPFFRVGEGVWRHRRVDLERARWSEKKQRAAERAREAAEVRWHGHARSMPRAARGQCPSPSSGEAEGPGPSARTGKVFENDDFRSAAARLADEGFLKSYLDPCRWLGGEAPAIAAPRAFTAERLAGRLGPLLKARGVAVVVERALGAPQSQQEDVR